MRSKNKKTLLLHSVEAHVALGEYCLIAAPVVDLPNGQSCVPQHFYGYSHSLEGVEYILSQISFSKNYPIFCDEDDQGLFIQVGIIGRENYQRNNSKRSKKIVYGRKWRVEPNLPTSEVIQTVFLALKKAREHEIRELFTLKSQDTGKISTPFNSHHDLPLMAQFRSLFKSHQLTTQSLTLESMQALLTLVLFDQTKIQCLDLIQRGNNQVLVDVIFHVGNKEQDLSIEFAELHGIECTLLLQKPTASELLYSLMDTLIQLSDRYVETHFLFNGFARFSREQNLQAIGEFSINTRSINEDKIDAKGKSLITEHNCSIDESRAPNIKLDQQKRRLAASFKNIETLEGFLPKGLE